MPPRVLLCVALLALGCSDATSNFFRATPLFLPTAQQNYEAGLRELKAGNYLSAQQYFQHIKSSFGFSKWATLAELGLADSNVGRGKDIEAVAGSKAFLKGNPRPRAGRAGIPGVEI